MMSVGGGRSPTSSSLSSSSSSSRAFTTWFHHAIDDIQLPRANHSLVLKTIFPESVYATAVEAAR